jgi:hypothetical protein
VTARPDPPLFAAPADLVELVAPVSPATEAVKAFHHRHELFEVHCPWCKKPQADCRRADLHDFLHRETRPYPDADPKRPCVAVHPAGVDNTLLNHPGPVLLFQGILLGSPACVEQYALDWVWRRPQHFEAADNTVTAGSATYGRGLR